MPLNTPMPLQLRTGQGVLSLIPCSAWPWPSGFVARSHHLIERAIGGVLVALGLGLAASSLQRS